MLPENKKIRVHVTLDPDIINRAEAYRKRLVGGPTFSGIVETALEHLLDSDRVLETVENNS